MTTEFERDLKPLPKKLKKTMTYDNGMEMALHELFTKKTGMIIYFAHPYSSWERGTNEINKKIFSLKGQTLIKSVKNNSKQYKISSTTDHVKY